MMDEHFEKLAGMVVGVITDEKIADTRRNALVGESTFGNGGFIEIVISDAQGLETSGNPFNWSGRRCRARGRAKSKLEAEPEMRGGRPGRYVTRRQRKPP